MDYFSNSFYVLAIWKVLCYKLLTLHNLQTTGWNAATSVPARNKYKYHLRKKWLMHDPLRSFYNKTFQLSQQKYNLFLYY